MTKNSRVLSATSTHSMGPVKQGDSEFGVQNHQDEMLLIDPEEKGNVRTHSGDKPKTKGVQKAPVKAALHDQQLRKGGKIAEIDNAVDPAAGYLEDPDMGMPIINNASADEDNTEDLDLGLELEAEFDSDDEVESEFEDLADLGTEGDLQADLSEEFDEGDDMLALGDATVDEPLEDAATDDEDDGEDELAFEGEGSDDDAVLLDVDAVPDQDVEDVAFATVANVVHVMKGNRIIASMGKASARKVGMADLYQTDAFHSTVEATLQAKGLRKGLVLSGFALAKVKITSSKATAKVVDAKVAKQVTAKMQSLARRDEALDQSMAIAAVGINRQYFKGTPNELRASLETQLTQAGVRGAARIVRAAFTEHGVSYARSIVTLATKISAMPEEVRNQYAEALDLTADEDFDEDLDTEVIEDDGEYDVPASVTAGLVSPPRRTSQHMLQAGVRSSAAMAILAGTGSLV